MIQTTRTKLFLTSLVIGFSLLLLPALAPNRVAAAPSADCDKSSILLGIPPWYKYLTVEKVNGRCEVTGPQENGEFSLTAAIGPILLAVIEMLLRIGTYLAIGIIIWGGFQYQISQGEPDRTKNARTTIINAIVGLVIAMFATAIVNLVGRNIIT